MGAFSLGLSAKLVMRFGIRRAARRPGCCSPPSGSLLFARAPVDGNFVVDVLPSMILLGFGAGMAFNPVLLAAMSDVEPSESGLASGVVNTSFMMGGALGLAVLASLAASRTDTPARVGRAIARGAQRRLPRRVPGRRDVRPGRGRRRRPLLLRPAHAPAHEGVEQHARRTGDRGGGVTGQSMRVVTSHELTAAAMAPASVLRL